jgi:hypothetical protein
MECRLSLICMTLHFAASVVQTVFSFPLLCYTFNKQGLSYIWLLIGCGCLTKLGRSWRGEITLDYGRGQGWWWKQCVRRKHSLKEDDMQDNVDPPSCKL